MRPKPPHQTSHTFLYAQGEKDTLRFITCGSVDDGKSTLIGRLLYDSRMLFEDQIRALEQDSRISGNAGGDLDFSLLVDGLAAEREQGITIDVAYRFFSTDRRKFIVADTPGHEQYTRNMATGASTADTAIILVDARKGVLTQTRRHSFIVSLMGLQDVVLAVNKMDLVEFDRAVFDRITEEYRSFAAKIGLRSVTPIPVSALTGDNVTFCSDATPWYDGPPLLAFLETIPPWSNTGEQVFRMPVQWVNRPDQTFRGFSGTIAGGKVSVGDALTVLPSGQSSRVARIVTFDGDLQTAVSGQAVTLTLTDEIDISRGDLLCSPDAKADVADQFSAHILWMDAQPMLPGRPYTIRIGTAEHAARISELKYKINVNTLEHLPGKQLNINEVAVCTIALNTPAAFDPYQSNRTTGGFILIDRISNATVACGMVQSEGRHSPRTVWQTLTVNKTARSAQKHQKATILWFTGPSGTDNSPIANHVEKRLHALGHHTYRLEADTIRHSLSRDPGLPGPDDARTIRRIAEAACLMADAGLIVLVSLMAPPRSEQRLARSLIEPDDFIEVYVTTSREDCRHHDTQTLHQRARQGEIPNVTGTAPPDEPLENPELTLDSSCTDAQTLSDAVIRYLRDRNRLTPP